MDWMALAAIASPIVTGAGVLWMRSEARNVAKEVVADELRGALAEFKLELLQDMNGKYLRTREQLRDNENFGRRLNEHSERLHDLEHNESVGEHRHMDYEYKLDKLSLDVGNLGASVARMHTGRGAGA